MTNVLVQSSHYLLGVLYPLKLGFCDKKNLNSLRFSLMKETDTKMTTAKSTVGKTGTKKKFWILDFTGFCCPSEFSGL